MQRKIKLIIAILILTVCNIGQLSAQGLYSNNKSAQGLYSNKSEGGDGTASVSHGLYSDISKSAPPSAGGEGDANKEVPIGDVYWILTGLAIVYGSTCKIKYEKRIKN